jgi:DNA polymerase-1
MSWNYITTQGEVEALLPRLMEKPSWGFDTETTGLDSHVDKVLTIQLGRPEEQFIIDARKVDVSPLRPFFESSIKKIAHNGKFDYKMMKGSFGIDVESIRCTYLGEKALHVGRRFAGFDLGSIIQNRLGITVDKALQKSFIGHKGEFSREQLAYAAADVSHLLPLSLSQCTEMIADGIGPTWVLECEALPCFGDMEFAGVLLDQDHWKELIASNEAEAARLRQEMDEYARHFFPVNLFGDVEINYDSPPQILSLLQRMGVQVNEMDFKTGKGFQKLVYKTDDKTLKKVKDTPFIKLLKAYRGYQIRINTFGYPFLKAVHPVTGRIHPSIRQYGTETGRPAAAKDKGSVNMLNIPRENAFRKGFIAPDDYVVETDDYSGCELRILAERSRDPGLIEAFANGIDVHCYVASRLFGVEVTKTNENKGLRTPTKPLNFGIAYGMGISSLYERINAEGYPITLDDTAKLYRRYCDVEFKVAVNHLRDTGKLAVEQGYLANANGRRRYWMPPNARDRDKYPNGERDPRYRGAVGKLEREGGNFDIQSVNADMTKAAMASIRAYKKKHKVRTEFANQVYDEIVTMTHKGDTEAFHPIKQKLMIEAAARWLKVVPMEVDGHVGPAWQK